MENNSKKELERLKRKIAAMNKETDELLLDIPIELMDSAPAEEEEAPPMDIPPEVEENMDEEILQARQETDQLLRRENRWLITLMLLVCALCAGIIGIFIYWLEVFLA